MTDYPSVHYRCTKCGHDWPTSDDIGEHPHGHLTSLRWGDAEEGYCAGGMVKCIDVRIDV